MSTIGLDEVLNRLSSKFNRIIYERDFVGSVNEDLQTVIKNKHECCVLVFPALSPNYLRVVRYQAKLCDLAVISLGSGGSKSVGVCHKKYLSLSTFTEEEAKKKNFALTQMAENASNTTRKKRPPIQLYVPPAQRKSRLSTPSTSNQKLSPEQENGKPIRDKSQSLTTSYTYKEKKTILTSIKSDRAEIAQQQDVCYCTGDVKFFYHSEQFWVPYLGYQCNCVKCFLLKDIFPYSKLRIFNIERMKHSFHWIKFIEDDKKLLILQKTDDKWTILNKICTLFEHISPDLGRGLFVPQALDFRESSEFIEAFENDFQNSHCLYNSKILVYIPDTEYYCYLSIPDFQICDDVQIDHYLNCLQVDKSTPHADEYLKRLSDCMVLPQKAKAEDLNISSSLLIDTDSTESPQMPLPNEMLKCDSRTNNACAKAEDKQKSNSHKKGESKIIDRVIVLDERKEPIKNGSINDKSKQNEHEQEKEIMRKTKQNINRKTRPIIKYVDDDNDTLKIGKNDNINNWEDLFNDEGELQEDIFSEIIHKVGSEVTIVKASEDYSAYASKPMEELEHMVELYDFPSTLETHDIIAAFSSLNSDSMYVKWVDDTHAILVLGSYTQAQKAIELSSPLIKVRSMSIASNLALEKANQFDLKPAMKRPQTNLQTARRLITSHLGAKSRVSKEQSAKEREDLRVAKELKKQAKKNERDAWEGSLRSAIK